MIVSFTPNPALDLTLRVPGLAVGEVNRAADSHLDPGGKGINVSRVVHRLGGETVALGVLGGHVGKLAERALRNEGVPFEFAWVRAETRLNVILQDTDTRAGTRVWDRGPPAGPTCVGRVEDLVHRHLDGARVFVSTGSLLAGMPDDFHVRLLEAARDQGAVTILDAADQWLDRGLAARPDLIKPNVREAQAVLGRELPDEEAVLAGARELVSRGAGAVVITRGAAGCVLVTESRALRAIPPRVELRSSVGSGDSMVAGLALALSRGEPLEEGLRLGTAAGAATADTIGTDLAAAEQIRGLLPEVRIEEL